MESTQAQFDGSSPNHIQVHGRRSITILDRSIKKMSHPSKLSYYRGSVVSGSEIDKCDGCRATILRVEKLETTEDWCARLNEVDHPYVIKSLGSAYGVREDGVSIIYLALEPFETTFSSYTRKDGLGVDVNGRFTEEMIALISNIVSGMEELHSLGFICQKKDDTTAADNIAVMRKGDSISAKILMFQPYVAGEEKVQKNRDWYRLGVMLTRAAWTEETMDLVKKIKLGQLKGRSILKHSALLTVKKKVDNVLALHIYVSVYYPKEPNQNQSTDDLDVDEICAANLKNGLDKRLILNTHEQIGHKTLREFIRHLRTIFEHESKHIPPELTKKQIWNLQKAKDLEHNLQSTYKYLWFAVHGLAAELNLEY